MRMQSVVTLSLIFCCCAITLIDEEHLEVTRVVFGSCSKADKQQPLWDPIVALKPDVFIWGGDNVYADKRVVPGWFDAASPEDIRKQYELMSNRSGYRALKKENVTILGTYDDHDYGHNNMGKHFPDKDASGQLLLDFLGEPANSARRKRRGVYASYVFGKGERTVKVVLLDTRYFRGKSDLDGGDGDMLGSEQWSWLEDQFKDSVSRGIRVTLLVSSVQILANVKLGVESWGQFSLSKRRLFALIRDTEIQGLIFLSGDVHFAELLRLDPSYSLASIERGSLPRICIKYPLHELTSSGMTHTLPDILQPFLSSTLTLMGPSVGLNFGVLEFDWSAGEVAISARGADGKAIFDQVVSLGSLAPSAGTNKHQSICSETIVDYNFGSESPVVRIVLANWLFGIIGLLSVCIVRGCCQSKRKTGQKKEKHN